MMHLQTFPFMENRKAYSNPSQTSKMDKFVKIINSQTLLTISAEKSILDVPFGFKYISTFFFPGTFNLLLGKKVLQEKTGEKRDGFLQIFGETSPNKLHVFVFFFYKQLKFRIQAGKSLFRVKVCLHYVYSLKFCKVFTYGKNLIRLEILLYSKNYYTKCVVVVTHTII